MKFFSTVLHLFTSTSKEEAFSLTQTVLFLGHFHDTNNFVVCHTFSIPIPSQCSSFPISPFFYFFLHFPYFSASLFISTPSLYIQTLATFILFIQSYFLLRSSDIWLIHFIAKQTCRILKQCFEHCSWISSLAERGG